MALDPQGLMHRMPHTEMDSALQAQLLAAINANKLATARVTGLYGR